jgi:hypothetical protein
MATPTRTAHIPPGLESAARANHPELANEPVAVLIRAGLAVLAGIAISDVIGQVRGRGRTSRLPDPSRTDTST